MGLVDDVKQAQEARGKEAPAEAVPVVSEAGEPATDMNAGLPGHEPAKAEAEVAPAAEAEVPAQNFKIGDQSFENIEEAMNYAQKLEREKLERDAYELGKQEGQPKAEEPKEDPDAAFYKQVEELMFEKPAEAIRLIEERAVSKATSTITQTSEAKQNQERTWNKFYEENKDLSAHREIVDFVLEKNWNTLGAMQPEKGLQKLAELTRNKLQGILKELRPEEVLPSGNAQVTSTSGQVPTQVAPKAEKLDFVQQARKLNKRELKQHIKDVAAQDRQ